MTTTITGLVSTTVDAGVNYPLPLVISQSGTIQPTDNGAFGLLVLDAGAGNIGVLNDGVIEGGGGTALGNDYVEGGTGVVLSADIFITNQGTIEGGAGGGSSVYAGGTGGRGLYASAGEVTNDGTIHGGGGGKGAGAGGTGGTGVYITGGDLANYATIKGGAGGESLAGTGAAGTGGGGALLAGGTTTNRGYIYGGAGSASSGSDGGSGGYGVVMSAGSLLNFHVISGGAGGTGYGTGGTGGTGDIMSGGVLTNYGTISGGEGGQIYEKYGKSFLAGYGNTGLDMTGGLTTNFGVIEGGAGGKAVVGGGGGGGLYLSSGTLTNYGEIAGGAGGAGIVINGDVHSGGTGGLGVDLNGGKLINDGNIVGGAGGNAAAQRAGTGEAGVFVSSGNMVNNGTITGGAGGTSPIPDKIIVAGYGGYAGYGVLMDGGTFTNSATGTIVGGAGGGQPGTYDGFGYGQPGGRGLELEGGTFTNLGVIIQGAAQEVSDDPGYGFGAIIDGGTLIDSGTITGYGAVGFSGNGTLVLYPGAVFNGGVLAIGKYHDTLELGGSTGASLSGIGSEFQHFAELSFKPGVDWSVSGSAGGLSGIGTISGFAAGDRIVIDNFVEGSFTYANGQLVLDEAADPVTLHIQGDYTQTEFAVSTDGTNTVITTDAMCYLRGTRILTPGGEVPIEKLAIGDRVVTRFGGIRPIVWIGRQTFSPRVAGVDGEHIPVRIRAGALGDKMPLRDLFVSPGHSMLIDDTLILASALVNGITITQAVPETLAGAIDYLQLDLGTHDCVIAEGAWSETFADGPNGSAHGLRGEFHNLADYVALYPNAAPAEQLVLCAPRPQRGPALEKLLAPIVSRAAAGIAPGPLAGHIDAVLNQWDVEGWALDTHHPALPVQLDVLLGDRLVGTVLACDLREDLRKAGAGTGRCAFRFRSPVKLPPEALATLTVRRASDKTPLLPSDHYRRAWCAPNGVNRDRRQLQAAA